MTPDERAERDPLDKVTDELRASLARLTGGDDVPRAPQAPRQPEKQTAPEPARTPTPEADPRALVRLFRQALDEHREAIAQLEKRSEVNNRAMQDRLAEIVQRIERIEAVGLDDRLSEVLSKVEGAGTATLRTAVADMGSLLRESERRSQERQQQLVELLGVLEHLETAARANETARTPEVLQGLSQGVSRLTELIDARFEQTVDVLQESADIRLEGERSRIAQTLEEVVRTAREQDYRALLQAVEEITRRGRDEGNREVLDRLESSFRAVRDEDRAVILQAIEAAARVGREDETAALLQSMEAMLRRSREADLQTLVRAIEETGQAARDEERQQLVQALEATARLARVEERQLLVQSIESAARATRDQEREVLLKAINDAQQVAREQERELQMRLIDERFEGLARFNRSDHQRIAQQIDGEQEVWKQTLRAVKELQASVANEIAAAIDRRLDAFEAPQRQALKAIEDRLQVLIERSTQQQDAELRVAMEQMGEVLRALASTGRAGRGEGYPIAPPSLSRTELDPEYRERRR